MYIYIYIYMYMHALMQNFLLSIRIPFSSQTRLCAQVEL